MSSHRLPPPATGTARFAAAVLFAGALSACSATDTTQIVVSIDTDLTIPTETDALHVEVTGPGGTAQEIDAMLTADTVRPMTLSVRPGGDALAPVTIVARATLAGATVVERRVVTAFVLHKSALLTVFLSGDCRGVGCPAEQSCDRGACVLDAVDGAALPDFTGRVPAPFVPGGDGGVGDSCVPTGELCNGRDDDCDGVVDNGFDLMNDAENCGSCGHACGSLTGVDTASCVMGSCVVTCDSGFGDCDGDPNTGCEANLDTDAAHCGRCDNACTYDHGVSSCATGGCSLDGCDTGFEDCDGDPMNGCEADLTSPSSCGRCGHDCGGVMCQASGFCEAEEIVSIATGSQHSCALRANGASTCWGLGAQGQLGTGATMSSRVPVDVVGAAATSMRVVAGGNQTCLVTAGGASCWGNNSNGQLGDGTTTSRSQPTPVDFGLMRGFSITDLSVGSAHTCAVGADMAGARVYCWGTNRNGQLGVGDIMDRRSPVQTDPTSLTEPVSVAAGGRHSCAVLASGDVYCWGAGAEGQIGDGTRTDRHRPAQVHAPGSMAGFANLADGGTLAGDRAWIVAGASFTCALHAGGQVLCWGDNARGQLGDGTTVPRRTLPTPVSGVADAVAIAAGDAHACALRMDGRVSCWGANSFGQLGDGSTTERNAPVDVMDVPGDVVEVSAGAGHTCLRTGAGRVYCFGRNAVGQLGDGTVTQRETPVAVSTLP